MFFILPMKSGMTKTELASLMEKYKGEYAITKDNAVILTPEKDCKCGGDFEVEHLDFD